eukprot:2551142-Amphidinium_carterae.2
MGAGMAAGGAMGSSGAPPASMPAGPGGAGSPCPIRASQMGMAGGMGGPSPQPGPNIPNCATETSVHLREASLSSGVLFSRLVRP